MSNNTVEWLSFWNEKAGSLTDFQATGRSKMDIVGFLSTIREIAAALNLGADDEVLDIGCGTGIVALALSPWVRRVHGIDISGEMIARAQTNCKKISTLSFSQGNIVSLDRSLGRFDKILAYSVLQYLKNEDDVVQAFKGVGALLKRGGIAYLAANPDPDSKEKYLETFMESTGSEKKKELNRQLVDATLWIPRNRISALAEDAGMVIEVKDINPGIWQHFYMYDLVLKHERT